MNQKKKLKPNQTQLNATELLVAVAQLWDQSGCQLPLFEKY